MKTYKLDFVKGLTINGMVLAIACALFYAAYTLFTSSLAKDSRMTIGVLIIALLAFLCYLIKVKLDIAKDKFKSISIDKDKRTFTLTAKNSEPYAINFDDVEGVYMISGEILRGIPLGYVKIKTKDNRSFGVTISKINDFYVNLPDVINKNLEEYTFFRTIK